MQDVTDSQHDGSFFPSVIFTVYTDTHRHTP